MLLGSIKIKPELEWHIQNLAGHSGVLLHTGQTGDVSNHVGVSQLVTSGLGQLVPDVEPRFFFTFSSKVRLYLKVFPPHYHLVVERIFIRCGLSIVTFSRVLTYWYLETLGTPRNLVMLQLIFIQLLAFFKCS